MNNLYEYIDPIASPYEAFCSDSENAGSGLPIPAHWHYYAELLYILEGRVRISMENAVKICGEDTVILFPPRCVHGIDAFDKSERVRYYVVKFDSGNLPSGRTDNISLRSSLQGISASVYPCDFAPDKIKEMNLLPLFEEIVKEYREKDYAYSMIFTADICKIMVKLIRCWQKEGYLLPTPGIHPSYELGFDLISEYIDSHYFEELTVEKLSAMCNMSHSTFFHEFLPALWKDLQGIYHGDTDQCRRKYASFSNYDVSFIAQEVGYADCSYFIRCYKKLKGITPKQARKERK